MGAAESRRKRAWRERVLRRARRAGNVAETCRLFGLSRTAFYKWSRRYAAEGLPGLDDRSRRPGHPPRLTPPGVVAKVVFLRCAFGLGPEKIRRHLAASFGVRISGPGVWKILRRLGLHRRASVLRRPGTKAFEPDEKHVLKLDVRPVDLPPAPRRRFFLYQAADAATRVRYLRTHDRPGPATAVEFFEEAVARLPFLVGAVETDDAPEWRGYFHAHVVARGIDHVIAPAGRRPVSGPDFEAGAEVSPGRFAQGAMDDPNGYFAAKLREWESLYKIGR
ncbi:MAG: helix-turn-helix domain-containing protein [Candidatus Aminicenantes bacterium]|nr:helix-turn-helix domain-containing protein [Candidatus Aminicenantes bacterium]